MSGDSAQIVFSDGKMLTFKCFQGEGCEKENNIFNSATKIVEEDKRLKTITTTHVITNKDHQIAE